MGKSRFFLLTCGMIGHGHKPLAAPGFVTCHKKLAGPRPHGSYGYAVRYAMYNILELFCMKLLSLWFPPDMVAHPAIAAPEGVKIRIPDL